MKPKRTIGLLLAGYVILATVQDGPIQVWLIVLAPLALIAIAFVMQVADHSLPR
jgi:hypothetical protein